ncbi:hypothetical protein Y1Q_0008471 [Alligator mississippiensis]|uniref:Uncharacterized protein n=1 Tax=Alligator mississippiensis TaxID=8496 RepID=A0A151M1E5_ALLMI|nr:hypothetical protein Y1Q_0008471 [Alligator mississippiensis]
MVSMQDNEMTWEEVFPYVMMTYRSSVQSSAEYTPYMVLFGQEMCLPVDVVYGTNVSKEFNNPEYVTKVTEYLSSVSHIVKTHQATATQRQKEHYDLRVTGQVYEPWELVWVQNQTRRVAEEVVHICIMDLESRDLEHLWLCDGSCLFSQQARLDVNWGIFEVNGLVHRGKEEGELFRDVVQLDKVEANSRKDCKLFEDLLMSKGNRSQDQEEREDMVLLSLVYQEDAKEQVEGRELELLQRWPHRLLFMDKEIPDLALNHPPRYLTRYFLISCSS